MVEKMQAWLLDVAIPGDDRRDVKEMKMISKYQDLRVEVERLWEKKAIADHSVGVDPGSNTQEIF